MRAAELKIGVYYSIRRARREAGREKKGQFIGIIKGVAVFQTPILSDGLLYGATGSTNYVMWDIVTKYYRDINKVIPKDIAFYCQLLDNRFEPCLDIESIIGELNEEINRA